MLHAPAPVRTSALVAASRQGARRESPSTTQTIRRTSAVLVLAVLVFATLAVGPAGAVAVDETTLAAQDEVPGLLAAGAPADPAALSFARGSVSPNISRGLSHSLYLDPDGQVWAWGLNTSGQLGNGSSVSSPDPVKVTMTGALAGVQVVQVAAGTHHSMALGADGHVYTWGSGATGSIGDGARADRPLPVRVGGVLEARQIVKIEAGGVNVGQAASAVDRSFAVDQEGRVYAWGSGNNGALGIGLGTEQQLVPAVVGGALASLRVIQVSTSHLTTVALTDDGRIFSWGLREASGSFGNGAETSANVDVPTALNKTGAIAGARIVQVAAGASRSTALSDSGELFTWGHGGYGALGTGSTDHALVPVRVDATLFGPTGVTPVLLSSGYNTTGVLGAGGELLTWGRGQTGQLGNGGGVEVLRPTPVDLSGALAGARVVQYSQRYNGALALTEDGRLVSWGEGASGQLGDGSTVSRRSPTAVGAPRVTKHPQNLDIALGAPAVLTAVAVGVAEQWAVRWQSSTDGVVWTDIPGATDDALTIPQVTQTDDGAQLRAVYSNAFGETASEPATLTVLRPPVVTVHPPEHLRSLAWLEVTLVAEATGSAPMTVRWETSDDSGATWAVVDGAAATTCSFTAASAHDGRLVRAVFVNAQGSAATTHTELEVVRGVSRARLGVTPSSRLVESLVGATS